MLIDTHAHIDMLSDPELGIKEARAAGVKEIIIPSASEDSFEGILELCDKHEDVYATLGVHPEDCEKFNNTTAEKIMKLAKHPKVVAIGEIGLDYHYTKENKDIQKRVFNTQLEIAKILNLPVVIHDREAHGDVLEILKAHEMKNVLLHCYSGSVEFMRECEKLGYKIALGGVVTFKNAREPKEVAAEVNLENLMLETDCPYLAPHPFRGQENSPKYIGFVAKEIANLRNIPYDSIVKQTSINARKFFNIENK
ncbi:MAG: TatD family hydrolase [Candidatus Gastranaerophilales bacterium]|nr:TatD family hydrolase [Candidatus Gastranaerophilales bacterium]